MAFLWRAGATNEPDANSRLSQTQDYGPRFITAMIFVVGGGLPLSDCQGCQEHVTNSCEAGKAVVSRTRSEKSKGDGSASNEAVRRSFAVAARATRTPSAATFRKIVRGTCALKVAATGAECESERRERNATHLTGKTDEQRRARVKTEVAVHTKDEDTGWGAMGRWRRTRFEHIGKSGNRPFMSLRRNSEMNGPCDANVHMGQAVEWQGEEAVNSGIKALKRATKRSQRKILRAFGYQSHFKYATEKAADSRRNRSQRAFAKGEEGCRRASDALLCWCAVERRCRSGPMRMGSGVVDEKKHSSHTKEVVMVPHVRRPRRGGKEREGRIGEEDKSQYPAVGAGDMTQLRLQARGRGVDNARNAAEPSREWRASRMT
ncbi:hypothetical protein B0H19DRAFT_1239801 [Mycena capillaripes]|nr:hypothetical protein B0H19DRAFT_1239801 [Mycena capillaripes]